ncbi:MAG: serine/threonine protein kinase [Myxococcales bacterium]|nr:serine/threonine protein kinase [Myxococcales bacterium]
MTWASRLPATTSAATPGRRFELLRTLGVGSFGTVYLAEMEGAGGFRRRVALKLLNPTWDQASDASTRLRDEGRLLGRLQHRHIVRVDDLLRLDGRWALVMEYVAGVDLEAAVAPPPDANIPALTTRAALEVVAAVANALRAASETPGTDDRPLAVVHRDIKPSNIRVTASGDLKVLDFGVARADFAGREAHTERMRYGSLGYMSPERLLGGDETSAGDVYALGVVLYELLTRTAHGRSELAPEPQADQVRRGSVLVESIADVGTAQLFRDMLAYEPEDRPSARSVEERARALFTDRSEPDLAAWCAGAVPLLAAAMPDDTSVRGRILAESDGSGQAIVTSPTMVLPADGAEPDRADVTRSSEASTPEAPDEPARVGGSLRMAWIVGAVVALGIAGAVSWMALGPAQPGPGPAVQAIAASAVTAPVAPVEAPPVPDAPVGVAATPLPDAPRTGVTRPESMQNDPTPSTPSPPPAPPAAVDRLRSAKFEIAGSGERLDVVCGDKRASGDGNVLINGFPPGDCTVSAGGDSTTVSVVEPRKVDCTRSEGKLACR